MEQGALVWSSHWLLICGSFLIVSSVIFAWVKFAYSRNIAGFELPVQAWIPHLHYISYGLIGIAVLAITFYLGFPLLGCVILLIDWMAVPARMIFRQPPLLRRLGEEEHAVIALKALFSASRPEPFPSAEETRKRLDLLTPSGRLAMALPFLGLGWYCFGLGAIFVTCYAISRLPAERMAAGLALVIVLPIAVMTALGLSSVVAQYYLRRAALARAAGRSEQIIACYRQVLRRDRWYRSGIEICNLLGGLQRQANIADGSAERAINRAVDLRAEKRYESAVLELQRAGETKPALAHTVGHEVARIYFDRGLADYQSGETAAAVAAWQQAHEQDLKGRLLKSQTALLYLHAFLARGHYELGNYQAALESAIQWIEATGDHAALQAEASSLAADCCARLNRNDEGRHYADLARQRLGRWRITRPRQI